MSQEPPPQPGQQPVFELAKQDILQKLDTQYQIGKETYGSVLQTFNGRNAYQDALAELVDLGQYLKQLALEKEALEQKVKRLEYVKYCAKQLIQRAENAGHWNTPEHLKIEIEILNGSIKKEERG